MDDLIEALTIFKKYKNDYAPTHCMHDELWVYGIEKEVVTKEDISRLTKIGFDYDSDSGGWRSYRFGSC